MIRILGGNIAGAIGLLVISLLPGFGAFSPIDALSCFGLSALMFLVSTRSWTHHRDLKTLTALGLIIVSLLPLSRCRVAVHAPVDSPLRDSLHYSLSVGRLFLEYVGVAPGHFRPLLTLESGVTLWWLYASIQSGNRVPFSLTAIPVAYLLSGSLTLSSNESYARPVHPILLANLIALVGLWWRGRTNKRVLDSTTN